MCNIWKLAPDEFLSAEDYRNLPSTLENVNVTGGEALLRKDIVEVVHAIYENSGKPRVILATNGFRTEKTLTLIESIYKYVPTLGIAISLDGIGKMHDQVRGVRNAFDRATATLRGLRLLGLTDVRIGFTANVDNVSQLPAVHGFAEELSVEFSATVAQNSEVYYSAMDNLPIPTEEVEKSFKYLVDHNLRSFKPKKWFRAYFDQGVLQFVKEKKRMTSCSAASDFFYLSPKGDVYPCLTLPHVLGNIRAQTFNDIWQHRNARLARKVVKNCAACWMVCTARTELKKRPIKALSWVVKEKFSRHLFDIYNRVSKA
jgi:MoaA/NifB/PqqE/SkfB family radical SAM enzyme